MTDVTPHPAFAHDGSKPLPYASHEEFAQAVVRLNNQAQAWREVYKPPSTMHARISWNEASLLARRIDVGLRIDWLRAQSFERSQISTANLMRVLYDIATADRTEIIKHIVGNCRHCHGVRYQFRWIDGDEFAAACETIERHNLAFPKLQKPLPNCDGGFGYAAHDDPNAMCPECMGVGTRTVWVADTTTLSDKARKLLTGQVDKAGLPVLVDQLQARDQLHKLAGAYKTDSNGGALTPPVPQPGDVAKGDASVSYMAMIHGDRKRA